MCQFDYASRRSGKRPDPWEDSHRCPILRGGGGKSRLGTTAQPGNFAPGSPAATGSPDLAVQRTVQRPENTMKSPSRANAQSPEAGSVTQSTSEPP